MVHEWIKRFKNGHTSIKHEEGARRPSMSITDVNTEWVHDVILQNRWVTTDEVAHQLQIGHGAAYEIIRNRLAFHKCVHDGSQKESHNWTKRNVLTSANGFWITVLLEVTSSWKGSSREMKHGSTITNQRLNGRVWNRNIPICPPSKSSECIQLQESLRLTVFWDSQGLLLEHCRERGSTVNSSVYSEVLCDKLKPALWSKWWGLLSDGVVLLPDNAHSDSAAHTVVTVKKPIFEVLERSPCSPDLAPPDYHLFHPIQQALRGCQFTTEQQLKETVHVWLVCQPKAFYCEGIWKIVQQWRVIYL